MLQHLFVAWNFSLNLVINENQIVWGFCFHKSVFLHENIFSWMSLGFLKGRKEEIWREIDWDGKRERGRRLPAVQERRGVSDTFDDCEVAVSTLRVLGGESAISNDPRVLLWNRLLLPQPFASLLSKCSQFFAVFVEFLFCSLFVVFLHQWL